MRLHTLLSMVPPALLLAGASQACGNAPGTAPIDTDSGADAAHADARSEAGDDAAGDGGTSPGDDSGIGPTGPCGWIGLQGLDASCATGSDCKTGQVCLVASGCFCTPQGRCTESPCEGGPPSQSCASTACSQSMGGNADPDAGTITCFVEGC